METYQYIRVCKKSKYIFKKHISVLYKKCVSVLHYFLDWILGTVGSFLFRKIWSSFTQFVLTFHLTSVYKYEKDVKFYFLL